MITRAAQRKIDDLMAGKLGHDLESSLEIIPGRLYMLTTSRLDVHHDPVFPSCMFHNHTESTEIHCFSTARYVYQPFHLDFGPLHLAHLYRFCKQLNQRMNEVVVPKRCYHVFTDHDPAARANTAYLVGAYLILYHDMDAESAFSRVSCDEPYLPFRDASMSDVNSYPLTVRHVLQAVERGRDLGFIDFENFNADVYEFYECVENGDFNVLVPNLFLAFAGPISSGVSDYGYKAFTPRDYVPIFRNHNVSTVIRLNKKCYDKNDFVSEGFTHHDFFFVDGTCPTQHIVRGFIDACERSPPGLIAVHCKAGLGRTGTTVGCYLMKHFDLTAEEAMGWIRICRPGSVIGCQQHFLKDMESDMREEGRKYRAKHKITLPWENHDRADDSPRLSVGSDNTFLMKHINSKNRGRRRRLESNGVARKSRRKKQYNEMSVVTDGSLDKGSGVDGRNAPSQGDMLNRRKSGQMRGSPKHSK